MSSYSRYRIGVINDFRSTFAFVDYQKFVSLDMWDACCVSSPHRGYHKAEDSIGVFLNFKMVGEFKEVQSAKQLLQKLIEDAPVNLRDYQSYLLEEAFNGNT